MENLNNQKLKLTIKLPINEKGKFKLQSRGNLKGRQFLTAVGLLASLERALLRKELKEKMTIVIKSYLDSHFENINETICSNDRKYLLYCTTCFLEDYISKNSFRKAKQRFSTEEVKNEL